MTACFVYTLLLWF